MKPNARELEWFRTANSNPPPGFYPFKERFLKRFATPDGYDLQSIDHPCWSCDGMRPHCQRCGGDGVFRTSEHWLERWRIGGQIYHRPVERYEIALTNPVPVSEIQGKVKHEPVTEKQARRAYHRLVLRFEPVNFFTYVCNWISHGLRPHRATLYFRLMKLRDRLDLFPAEPRLYRDDVPF